MAALGGGGGVLLARYPFNGTSWSAVAREAEMPMLSIDATPARVTIATRSNAAFFLLC